MTSSAKLNNPRSLINPPEGGGGRGRYSTKFYIEGSAWRSNPFKHIYIYIYIPFLTEKVSLKETY